MGYSTESEPAIDQIRPEHVKRFRRLARGMVKLLREVREYSPAANLYLEDSGNWCLMVGPSHDDRGDAPLQENVAVYESVMFSGGGAW